MLVKLFFRHFCNVLKLKGSGQGQVYSDQVRSGQIRSDQGQGQGQGQVRSGQVK